MMSEVSGRRGHCPRARRGRKPVRLNGSGICGSRITHPRTPRHSAVCLTATGGRVSPSASLRRSDRPHPRSGACRSGRTPPGRRYPCRVRLGSIRPGATYRRSALDAISGESAPSFAAPGACGGGRVRVGPVMPLRHGPGISIRTDNGYSGCHAHQRIVGYQDVGRKLQEGTAA